MDDIFDDPGDDFFAPAPLRQEPEPVEQLAVPRENLEPEAVAILDDETIETQLQPVDILADYPWARNLTYKQACFVLVYSGDTTDACNRIDIPPSTGRSWLRRPEVRYAIRERLRYGVEPELVADRDERLALWTRMMRNDRLPIGDRLKASELLGKANCDFSEKRVLAGDSDQPLQIVVDTGISRAPNDPIDITPKEATDEP